MNRILLGVALLLSLVFSFSVHAKTPARRKALKEFLNLEIVSKPEVSIDPADGVAVSLKFPKVLKDLLEKNFPKYRLPEDKDFVQPSALERKQCSSAAFWNTEAKPGARELPFIKVADFTRRGQNSLALLLIDKYGSNSGKVVTVFKTEFGFETQDLDTLAGPMQNLVLETFRRENDVCFSVSVEQAMAKSAWCWDGRAFRAQRILE